ncbi:MAG: DUF3786 domain-containing protein [Desulfoferrobacter sp.]
MRKLSHLEIYKLLEKSNCRQCRLPTCLAFAAAVLRGDKRLDDCPYLDGNVIEEFKGRVGTKQSNEDDWEQALEELQNQIRGADFSSLADRLGAEYSGGRLVIKCLGKDFYIDKTGSIASDCHKNRWLAIPLLNYVINSSGLDPAQYWVPLRELEHGATWSRLFAQRCEKPLKQLVDNHTDLFELIVDIFDGKTTEDNFSSDISVVIHPLPKLPMLICYWKKEAGFDSTLSLFFDSTANENLNIESIYTLGVGLITMFEKIVLTHDKLR